MRPEIPEELEARIDEVYERGGYSTASELVRDAVRQRVTLIEREGEHPPLMGLALGDGEGARRPQGDGGSQITRPAFEDRHGDDEGILYGVNTYSMERVRADRFGETAPMPNALVLGSVGTGKTVSSFTYFTRELEERDDLRVVYIDSVGSGQALTDHTDSQTITLGEGVGINPVATASIDEADDSARSASVSSKADVVTALLHAIPQNDFSKDDIGTNVVIQEAVKRAFDDKGLRDTTLADVCSRVDHIAEHPSGYTPGIGYNEATDQQLGQMAVKVMRKSRIFDDDEGMATFTRPTSFDITDNRVTYIKLVSDSGSVLTNTFGAIGAVEAVFEQARATDDHIIIAADDGYALLRSEYAPTLLKNLRHARHYDIGWHLIAQGLETDVPDVTMDIVNQCSIKHLHRVDEETARNPIFGLTDDEVELVTRAKRGSDEGGSESLLMLGDRRIPTTVEAPKRLWTSNY